MKRLRYVVYGVMGAVAAVAVLVFVARRGKAMEIPLTPHPPLPQRPRWGLGRGGAKADSSPSPLADRNTGTGSDGESVQAADEAGENWADVPGHVPTGAVTIRGLPLLLGVVALAALTLVNIGEGVALSMHLQFALLVGGAALVTWGMGGVGTCPGTSDRADEARGDAADEARGDAADEARGDAADEACLVPTEIPRTIGILRTRPGASLLAILLLALVVRVWDLNDAVRWYVDEFLFADTYTILRDNPTQPLLVPQVGLSSIVWVYPYLQWWTVTLFGADFGGLRLISALLGVATVAAVYLLVRALLGGQRGFALLAALALAVFPPHVHFSRLGLYNIADPLFGVLALWLLARALRGGRQIDYAGAGALLALTGYFYEGGRVFYPALVLTWLLALIGLTVMRRCPRYWRVEARGLLVLALTGLLVAAPLWLTVRSMGDFESRVEQIGGLRLDALTEPGRYIGERLLPALLHFVARPDESGWHYGGETPLLLVYIAPLALLGLFALWRRADTRPAALLLSLWVLLAAVGSSLLDYVGFTARFVVVFPALALLIGVGIGTTAAWVGRLRRQWERPALALLLSVVIFGQLIYYFGVHIPFYNGQLRPYRDYIDVMYRSLDFPADTPVYVIVRDTQDVWVPHLDVLRRYLGVEARVQVVDAVAASPAWLGDLYDAGGDIAFFVEQEDRATLHLLEQIFPLEAPQFSPYNVPQNRQYVLLIVPGGERQP